MKMTRKNNWMLRAAIAAVPVIGLCSLAGAQYRTGNDGRALDANPRTGSGGDNDGNIRRNVGPTADDIIYGNVTGGRQFRGHVSSFDPNRFHGNLAGTRTDRFVRDSIGAPTNNTPQQNTWQARTFYGESRGVNAPTGTVSLGYGTGGGVVLNRPIDSGMYNTGGQTSGTLVLPMVDGSNNQRVLLADPIGGVRQLPTDRTGELLQNDPLLGTLNRPTNSTLDQGTLSKMQQELRDTANGTPQGGTAPVNPDALPNPNLAPKPLTDSPGSPSSTAIPNNALDNAINPQASLSTSQSLRSRLVAPPPEQQSAQYAEMMKRFKERTGDTSNMSDEQASRVFNEQKRLHDEAVKTPGAPGTPAPGTPGATPAPGIAAQPPKAPTPGVAAPGAVKPGVATPGAAPGAAQPGAVVPGGPKRPDAGTAKKPPAKVEPVKVKSLATGVPAKGFSTLLTQAEDLMKQGKFASAIDQYDAAEQVAPNNPLVKIGRANAELGAAYYLQAENHLRDAFNSDPALLTAQYDLKGFFGEDRLAFLQKDLKDIANADQKQSRPVFLLGYISYNTGDEAKADSYLDLADKRSGGKDPIYKLLRDNWSLPEKKSTTQPANK